MYRIKTDIRQYKCDSVEKVEKLIHNWVIRPNDLVYSNETQRWSPIGEHPLFVRLFEILAEQERAEPATQVSESPLGPATAHEEDRDEVTRIKERPVFDEDFVPEDIPAAPLAEDEEPTNEQEEKSPEDETLMGRTTSVEAEEPSSEIARPEPPPEVEPVPRPDEVTVMTAKTLDLIITPDDESNDEEKTNVAESPLLPKTPTTPFERLAQASEPNPEISLRAPRIGRHDLPEEFFATNEIHGPVSRDSVPPVDDLKALYNGTSVDDAWGSLVDAEEEDLRATEQMESPLEPGPSKPAALKPPQVEHQPEVDQGDDSEDDDWHDDYEISPIPLDPHGKHAPRVADVYNIPLPFPVLPSEEDQAAGLKRATTSKAEKDRNFPYPAEKTFKHADQRTFDLTPPKPKDRTLHLVGTVIAGVVVILIISALM